MSGVARNVGELLFPWTLVLYVWLFGLHWVVVGLGCVYVAAFLIAGGRVWERHRGE